MKLLKFILQIFDVFSDAARIRQDEERRQKSVKFAVTAIAYSITLLVMVCLGAFIFSLSDASGLLVIFVLIIGIAFIIGGLLSFIGALLRVIAQFTINRRAMSWIALIVFILSLVASVIVTLYILG